MKTLMCRLILFTLLYLSVQACGSDTKSTQPEKASAPASSFKTEKVPIPFAGSWISASYLSSLMEHQSPKVAQEGSEACYIEIPAETLLPTTLIYNFHEGISDLLPVVRGGKLELWEKQEDTLSNVKYVITPPTSDTLLLGIKPFVKINPVMRDGEPAILEELLFQGTYTSKKNGDVEFKANGEVTGLGKYKYYKPVIDYFDAGMQVDQVGLGETPDQWEYFGFTMVKDKLDIFTLKCKAYDSTGTHCVFVGYGDKVYSLRRNNN